MDNLKDENGNSVFSQEDKNVFLAKCLENYRYEEFESEFLMTFRQLLLPRKLQMTQVSNGILHVPCINYQWDNNNLSF